MDFDNLHQVLRNLYQEMMPLCGDMIGVAKGIAGLGALFYVAYRVWKALANAEPIDVFPLLRPFAIGLCVMFFQMCIRDRYQRAQAEEHDTEKPNLPETCFDVF